MSRPPRQPLPENEGPRTQSIAVPAPGRQEEPAPAQATGPVGPQPGAPATTAYPAAQVGQPPTDHAEPAEEHVHPAAPAPRPAARGSSAAGQRSDRPEAGPGDDAHVHRTGPMEYVPVPPPLRSQPGRPGGSRTAAPPPARAGDRAAAPALGLAVLALLVLQLGLTLRFGGTSRLWTALPTWSAFATVAALLLLVPAGARVRRAADAASRTAWQVAAGGAVGSAVFWVLIVLPLVATDRGFTLTAALALAGGAVWLSPGRER